MLLTCYKIIWRATILNVAPRNVLQIFHPRLNYMKILGPPLYWKPAFVGCLHSQSIMPTWSRALLLALVKEQCTGHLSLLLRSTQVSGGYGGKSGQIQKSEFDGPAALRGAVLVYQYDYFYAGNCTLRHLNLSWAVMRDCSPVTRQTWGSGMNPKDWGTRPRPAH